MDTSRFQRVYQSTDHFELVNPNPRWANQRGFVWRTGDCAIRALANSVSISWEDAYDFLSAKARRDFSVPNDRDGYRKWLVENGAVWVALNPARGKKRMTALEFAIKNKGRYILALAHHDTACVDGKILDAWNCGSKCVYGYFDMSNFVLS